jgi:hypothetical protein
LVSDNDYRRSNTGNILNRASDRINQPSRVFGARFPLPMDGKSIVRAIAEEFASEFNDGAARYLQAQGYTLNRPTELRVASAYPTIRQHCPRMVVMNTGGTSKLAGLGGDIEIKQIQADDGSVAEFLHFRGQVVTDNIEVTIACVNDMERDEVFVWWQQYLLDALYHSLRSLQAVSGLIGFQVQRGSDDQVVYQGSQGQPGFEFYTATSLVTVTYDQIVARKIDAIKEIIDWQTVLFANGDPVGQ